MVNRRFNRMAWFKQLFPRTLYSIYHHDDQEGSRRYFSIWRQWMGRAYDIRRFPIAEVS